LLHSEPSTAGGYCARSFSPSSSFSFDAAVVISRVYFGGFARDFPHYINGREFKKMKTFIVYDLDSQMPVAVGEQVSAETARYCASVATGILEANLLAEEIDLEKQITY